MNKSMVEQLKKIRDAKSKENGFRDIDGTISSMQKQLGAKQDEALSYKMKLKTINDVITKNEVNLKHCKENKRELDKVSFESNYSK